MKKISLKSLWSHFVGNDSEILSSKECLCLSCLSRFSAREVSDWCSIDGEETAICPKCGMPYVLGDASNVPLSDADAKKASKDLFNADHFSAEPEDYYRFMDCYMDGRISHTEKNEALYVQYLKLLMEKDRSLEAFHALGDYYEYGTEFTEPDLKKALNLFLSERLSCDHIALYRAGQTYLALKDKKNAFICFSKANSLKSAFGFLGVNDCFRNGWFVPKDFEFAMDSALEYFEDDFREFVLSEGNARNVLPNLCLRLASFFLKGEGVEKNPHLAETFLLIGSYGFSLLERDRHLPRFFLEEKGLVDEALDIFLKKLEYRSDSPFFDASTFQDSLVNNVAIPFVYEGSAKIIDAHFDPFEHVFEFTIAYPYAPLIIDCGNGICRFENKTIHWRFEEVKSATFKLNQPFEVVDGDIDTSYDFVHLEGKKQTVVASIVFEEEGENESPTEERPFGGKDTLA